MIRPPVYKLVAALVIVLPVTIVWSPWVVPAVWKLGGSLVGDLMHARYGLLDTAFGFTWAVFGCLGIAGLWVWVISPLQRRRLRTITGTFLVLGVIAAIPWAVGGVRQAFWPGMLLIAPCLLAIAVLVAFLRPNNTPHTDGHVSAVLQQSSPARAGERGR